MSSAECVYYIIKRAKNQFYISNRPNGRKIRFGSPNIAPRYTIIKIKKISLGRFFKIFLIVYSRIRYACLWALPTKTAFSVGTLAHPVGALWAKLKPTTRVGCNFGSPNRIRTGVLALKGRCPRPLDDGAKTAMFLTERRRIIQIV